MNYARIKKYDIANGPGMRASLYVSGCTHGCKGCFNREAWDFNYGEKWTEEVENDLIEHLKKPEIKGLNVLGGEPLQQGLPLFLFLRRVKKEVGKPIWLWTGYKFEDIIFKDKDNVFPKLIVRQCDVVIDGRFVEAKKDLSLKYRGSSNQRVINVKKTLLNGKNKVTDNIYFVDEIVELEGC